jgi:hypothetical protein
MIELQPVLRPKARDFNHYRKGTNMSNYTIHLSRREGRCIASIPELCISGEAANPEQALANVMLAESDALEKLRSSGLPLPPSVDQINPLPKAHELLMKAAWFFGKTAAAFVIFLILSAAVAAMVYPTFSERARTYILGSAAKEDLHKMLKHLGISVYIEDKVRTDHQ